VDPADYDFLCQMRWKRQISPNTFYACRNKRVNGVWTTIYMHRVIMNAPNGMDVDHINRNGLDNRRSKLRIASRAENLWNTRRESSKSRGRWWDARRKMWRERIDCFGKKIDIGHFVDRDMAAMAALATRYVECVLRGSPEIPQFDDTLLYASAQRLIRGL
jgi:hypothetical protein